MKNIKLFLTLSAIGFFLYLTFFVTQVIRYQNKFSETKLNISIEELKEKWGNPDEDFICKDCNDDIILKYKTSLALSKYVFKFDKKSELLIFKYDDTF